MTTTKKSAVSFLCFSLLFHCVSAYSENVALVLATVNTVLSERNGTEQVLKRGDNLTQGDAIVTKSGASVQIKYNDGTLVTIKENSHFEMLSFAPKGDVSIKMQLNSGALQYESNHELKNKHKAIIETPVVALSILGTKLNVVVDGKDCKLCQQQFDGKHHSPLNFDCKTYVDVKQGLVQGNQQFLGPKVTVQSGVFGANQSFTPGPIPWEMGAIGAPIGFVDNTIATNISTINNSIINNVTNTSMIDSIVAQSELVPLTLSCP